MLFYFIDYRAKHRDTSIFNRKKVSKYVRERKYATDFTVCVYTNGQIMTLNK